MTIYYQDDLATLYHGDCLDVLASMPDNSIDAESIRTLDPLPDPEPDWLDAPALPTREQIAMAIYKVLKPQYGDFGVPDDAADAVLDLLKETDR